MNKHTEYSRGQRAKELLDNEIYKDCIKQLSDGIVDKWRSAPIRDREGMHELKLMDKLLTDIEAYIKTTAETGKMAEIQLAQENNVAKLKRAGIM